MKAPYLVGIDLRDRPVVVVGGGAVARRKADGLRAAGAHVTVVAPVCDAMPSGVRVERRRFRATDLDGVAMAIAATDDAGVNAEVAAEARRRGIWVNVADDPEAGTVVLPAEIRRGGLRIAVSTGGASPALARRIRQHLEPQFGPEYGELVELLGRLRREWEPRAVVAGVSQDERRRAWQVVLDGPALRMLAEGRTQEAESAIRGELEAVLEGSERSADRGTATD